jgi:hypothetical protein
MYTLNGMNLKNILIGSAKWLLPAIFFMLNNSSKAQFITSSKANLQWVEPTIFDTTQLIDEVTNYAKQFIPIGHDLILKSDIKSQIGRHLLFKHAYQGVEVFGSDIKININNQGQIINLLNNIINFNNAPKISSTENACIWVNNGLAIAAIKQIIKDDFGVSKTIITDNKNNQLFAQSNALFKRSDSVVKAYIFNPDPLSTAEKQYGAEGGLFKNNNGADNPLLNAQRKPVSVTLKYENDTFYAANDFVEIKNLEPPNIMPFKNTTGVFDYNRSQSAFQELMCLYHIEELNNYHKSIGLEPFIKIPLPVDAHAYQGADMSRFEVVNGVPSLFFGTGGVPDAEDADVIIHEYFHAVGYAIAPNTTSGNERLAVEEANCDFMATQHSRAATVFNWRWVFNWDGHNEFWDGRNTDNNKKYPTNISSDFYSSSEIWSGFLNDLSLDIGRDNVTKLLLNSMYFYTNNMSMQTACDLLFVADSILFENANHNAIRNRAVQRGFTPIVGIHENSWFNKNVALINTLAFANGAGNAKIISNAEPISITIKNMAGKTLHNYKNVEELSLNPSDFESGILLVTVENKFGSKTYKLVCTH